MMVKTTCGPGVYLDMLPGSLERRPVGAPLPSAAATVFVEALVRPRDDLGSGLRLEDDSRVDGLGGDLVFFVVGGGVVVGHEAEGVLAHGRRGRLLSKVREQHVQTKADNKAC